MADKPCMLLLVAESHGSSPGRQGFKMAVAKDGEMMGSIGGGIMEHKLVALAIDLLKKGSEDVLCKQQVHNKTTKQNQSGLICSGEQTIIMLPVSKTRISTIDAIASSMRKMNENYFELSA